jgi:surface protein
MPVSEARQGLNAITAVSSVSAVASAGGGQTSQGRIPPPFGVNEFITTWKTDNTGVSASNQIQLPLGANPSRSSQDYYFQVDWGDGSTNIIQSATDPARIHTYDSAGTYTVKISGILDGWAFNNGGDRLKFLTIEKWGMMKIDPFRQFAGCNNLLINATDIPTIIELGGIFESCRSITTIPNIELWDTSGCTNMTGTFRDCRLFNDDVSGWNTSKCTAMFRMFLDAYVFNQNLSSWDTSNVTIMGYMFENAFQFNNGGSSGINNWITGKVTSFDSMFRRSGFNQPIGNWDITSATTLRSMFRESPFNQDLSNWDPLNVTQFPDVFLGCACATDCSSWNVSKGQNFWRMFASSSSLDFSLGSWDISSAAAGSGTGMDVFVYAGQVKFSTSSYSSGLLYWQTLSLNSNVRMTMGAAKYSAEAQSARQFIIDTYGWTIVDGGQVTP